VHGSVRERRPSYYAYDGGGTGCVTAAIHIV